MNLKHADLVPAEVTGDPSVVSFIERGPLTELSYSEQKLLWCGQLDAPELIVVGGCAAHFQEGHYTVTTARTRAR